MKKSTVCPGSGSSAQAGRHAATAECPDCGEFHRINKDKTIRHHKVLSSA